MVEKHAIIVQKWNKILQDSLIRKSEDALFIKCCVIDQESKGNKCKNIEKHSEVKKAKVWRKSSSSVMIQFSRNDETESSRKSSKTNSENSL